MKKKEESRPLETKSDGKIQRRCVILFEGDWEWLRKAHSALGPTVAIRELVGRHRKKTEAKAAGSMPSARDLEVDMEDIL
jgi:hypothetical protein